MLGGLGWGPILVGTGAGGPRFGAEDPLAPVDRGQWYHQILTEEAATASGWSAGAARELGWNAVGVDLYAYHRIWCAYGGPRRWRGARSAHDPLEKVHFDNLTSTAQIEEIWHRLVGGTLVGLEWAAGQGDVTSARQVIGVALHAIQDFYSHSTWIDDPDRQPFTWLEAWPGLVPGFGDGALSAEAGPIGTDLSTGGFATDDLPGTASPHLHGYTTTTMAAVTRLPRMLGTPLWDAVVPATIRTAGTDRAARRATQARRRAPRPGRGVRYEGGPGLNLDSRWQAPIGARTRRLTDRTGKTLNGDDAFDLAYGLALRESRGWLERLERQLTADTGRASFWNRVRSGPGTRWTAAYDEPARRAYEFVAAGHYPPASSIGSGSGSGSPDDGQPDSRAWFLRVDVSGRPTRTIGPLPPGTDRVVLPAGREGRTARVHAFRRAPVPELRLLFAGPIGPETTVPLPPEGS